MEYQNGQFLSAYTKNDTLFEGNVYTRLDGTKVVLNEDKKWLPISELKEIRLIQEANDDDQDIQKLVDADIGKCDIDKLSSLDDGTLGKVGDSRENELIKSGIKINKGDYSTRFTNSVKANSLAKDANAGNISISTALEKYKQSKDVDIDMRIKNTLKESFEDDDLLDDDFGVANYEDDFSDDEETDTFDEFDDEDFNDYDDTYDEDIDDVIVDKQEDDLLLDDAFESFSESSDDSWSVIAAKAGAFILMGAAALGISKCNNDVAVKALEDLGCLENYQKYNLDNKGTLSKEVGIGDTQSMAMYTAIVEYARSENISIDKAAKGLTNEFKKAVKEKYGKDANRFLNFKGRITGVSVGKDPETGERIVRVDSEWRESHRGGPSEHRYTYFTTEHGTVYIPMSEGNQYGIDDDGKSVNIGGASFVFDESKKREITETVDKEFEAAFNEFEESVVRYDTSKLYEFLCEKFGYEPEKNISNFEEAVLNLEEAEVNNRIKEFKFQQGRFHGDDRDLAGLYYITKNGVVYGNKTFNPTEAKEKLKYLRETYPEFTWGVQKTN